MPKVKSIDLLGNIQQVGKPDMDKLAVLTKKVMGERTVNGFAKECGFSPSTISRILNKKNRLTNDALGIIFMNAEEPTQELLKSLLEAQGLEVPQDLEGLYNSLLGFDTSSINRKTPTSSKKASLFQYLIPVFLDHGYLIGKEELDTNIQPDFCLSLTAKDGPVELCAFWFPGSDMIERIGAFCFFYPNAVRHIVIMAGNDFEEFDKEMRDYDWGGRNISLFDSSMQEHIISGKGIF